MKSLLFVLSTLFFVMPFLMAQDHGHGHMKASHGGEILEVGNHVAHIEMVHKKKIGIIMLFVLDAHGKTMGISNAIRLNITYKIGKTEKRKQVIGKALKLKGGKSSVFEAQDDIFKSEDFEGLISIKIKGKTYRVELHHDDHEGHDHHKGHDH